MSVRDALRPVEVDPLVLTRRATAGQHVLALIVDATPPLLLAAGATVAFLLDAPGTGWALAAIAVVIVVAELVMVARDGRSPGRRLAGTRTVERRSGVATGSALIADLLRGRLVTVDLRTGRDPFAPALAPLEFPTAVREPAPRRGAAPVAVLDSGERLPVTSALILGRRPSVPADAPAELYQWPDLSRTLSKSHTRLEWDGERAWAIDLGSTNGTLLLVDGGGTPLVPFQRTPVGPGAVLRLGDRGVTLVETP